MMWRFLATCRARVLPVIRLMRRFPYTSIGFIICVLTLLRHRQNWATVEEKQEFVAVSSEMITSNLFRSGEQDVQPKLNEELSFGVSAEGAIDEEGREQTQPGNNTPDEVAVPEQELHAGADQYDAQSVTDVTGKISSVQQLHQKLSSRIQNWRNLTQSEINNLSVVGRRLYLQEDVGIPQNRNFTILPWQCGPSIGNRFLKQYGNELLDPFRFCSVRNCNITYDSSLADRADAILFALHKTRGPSAFPHRTNFHQRWIWLSDETPYHTLLGARDKNLSHYNGYFNWSMTYRMDSDIPVPYGRTVEMSEAEASLYERVDYFNIKPNFTAVMGSNCGGRNKRWSYVKELKKYMDLHVYGGCGTFKCPGHFRRDCPLLNTYKFYLAFENSNCRDYITEKAWWNAIEKGAVPVVMGESVEGYKRHLPPKSFIHIDDFQSPKDLAEYLISLAKDPTKYMEYHAWRSRFRVLNEHGYFNSPVFHYCRLCEALNYNDPRPKEYPNLDVFWNSKTDCSTQTWVDRMNGISV
ncbi:alpha-(1,3)-fucosyltransferase 7-like isoform X2 [Palaemon carinicauda]|uniref:alpha-(1,3)-fucosyltransferase 7-like isoform X2 n=1 Tax=Palaemon carinicauda TaxID=392227 RepID=UPI0035B66CF3